MVKKKKDLEFYEGVGRRKTAVARVRLYIVGKSGSVTVDNTKLTKGQIMVNHVAFEDWAKDAVTRVRSMLPLKLTDTRERFSISILVNGGGRNGQIEAIELALSRSLLLADADVYKPILRQNHLLTRDPRVRQRRMVGTGGKARRQKQSPKR